MVLLNITPLFGAYIADQHLGRYLTLQYSNAFALLGHAIMVAAALPWVIPLPQAALAVIVVGFVFISVGWGGCRYMLMCAGSIDTNTNVDIGRISNLSLSTKFPPIKLLRRRTVNK